MKKVFLVGILALVVVGCVLAAGCTSADKQASGTMVSDEQLALLGEALPAMIAEVSVASGASMTGEKALELKKNIIFELEKASRASGYMTDEIPVADLVDEVELIEYILEEANRASGTMMTDGQLAALGTAIEAKLGETSQASGYMYDQKAGTHSYIHTPSGDIAPSPASGTAWGGEEGRHPIGAFIVRR